MALNFTEAEEFLLKTKTVRISGKKGEIFAKSRQMIRSNGFEGKKMFLFPNSSVKPKREKLRMFRPSKTIQ